MDANNIFESKLFKIVVLGLAGFIILGFVFGLGVSVGIKRAEFSSNWAEAYHTNFGGSQVGFLGNMMGQNLTEANGVFGQIIKINNPIVVVKGEDNIEKNILVDKKTIIVFQKKNLKLEDLKIDDNIIVIGDSENNGQIQAEFIRVMPPVPVGNGQDNSKPGPRE